MSKLKATVFTVIIALATPIVLDAQTSRQDQLEEFALRHGCEVSAPLPNSDHYLVWLEYLQNVYVGAASPDIFAQCPASPYKILSKIFTERINQADLISDRERLLTLVAPQVARIQQGYGAAEYVSYVFFSCQQDALCFASVLEADEYWERICPDPTSNSPNSFELDLFENGGDMRFLLPYALTNCTLYNETNRAGTIYDVVGRIFDPIDNTRDVNPSTQPNEQEGLLP